MSLAVHASPRVPGSVRVAFPVSFEDPVDELLTVAQASEALGLTPFRLSELIRSGGLETVRVGKRRNVHRVSWDAIERYRDSEAALRVGVYFIGDEHESPVKVGFTRHGVECRLHQLQTGCWLELVVLGFLPGTTQEDERRAHSHLAEHRIRGEWFEREPTLAFLAGPLVRA